MPDLHPSGKAQQNAYVQHYNRTVRQEWLDLYISELIEAVQKFAIEWLWTHKKQTPRHGQRRVTHVHGLLPH